VKEKARGGRKGTVLPISYVSQSRDRTNGEKKRVNMSRGRGGSNIRGGREGGEGGSPYANPNLGPREHGEKGAAAFTFREEKIEQGRKRYSFGPAAGR